LLAEPSLFRHHLSHDQVGSLSQVATYVSHFAVHGYGLHQRLIMRLAGLPLKS
jgi:hypothetical protein